MPQGHRWLPLALLCICQLQKACLPFFLTFIPCLSSLNKANCTHFSFSQLHLAVKLFPKFCCRRERGGGPSLSRQVSCSCLSRPELKCLQFAAACLRFKVTSASPRHIPLVFSFQLPRWDPSHTVHSPLYPSMMR